MQAGGAVVVAYGTHAVFENTQGIAFKHTVVRLLRKGKEIIFMLRK